MSVLDLGSLVGEVRLDATLFEATYVRVVRQMSDLGARAGTAAAGTSELDKSLTQTGASANAAAAGLGRADKALVEAGVSTSEAALASSKLTQAQLRQTAALERLSELQASGSASTRQLAAAQASLIAANDRVALSNERVEESQMLGARTTDQLRRSWAAIPGPVKLAAVALIAAGAASVEAARKFQDTTTLIQTQAHASAQQVNVLRAGILAMSASVATSPDVLADAAYHIASVGQNSLTAAQQLNILRIAAEGAKIGHANLVDVTNALDAAIVSGIHGVSNYTQVMGVMNATVGAGDMSMQNFADAFGPLGAVLKGYNVTIQQAGAALATFGDNNLRGADAGTALRMAVQALAVPAANGKKMLEDWGLSAGNLSKQLQHGGLTEALDVLMQKMRANGITAKEQGDVLTEVFGKRAGIGLNTLMGELDRYHNKLDEVTKGGDTFAAHWTEYTRTLTYAWDRIKAGTEAAAISIGNRLLPDATRALSWIGTTGVNDVEALWHALSTNTTIMSGFHDLESAVSHVASALHNTIEVADPLAHVLMTVGGGTVLVAFRMLAVAAKDVATAVDDVTGFFAHNKTAAEALGIVLATMLVPAAVAAGKALIWTGLEATAAGILRVLTGTSTLSAALRNLSPAAIAARAAMAIVAVAVLGAINDLMQGDQAIKQLREDMSKPLPAGNVFEQVSKQIHDDLAPDFARLKSEGFNVGSMFSWAVHPVQTFNDAIGTTGRNLDKLSEKTQGQILGNLHDLQVALYGLGANPIDAQKKLTAVLDAMGLSANDLATKNFPVLLAQVNEWMQSNQAAQTPAEQVHADIVAIGSGAQTAAQDVQSLSDALDLLAGNAISADEGAIAFRNDLVSLDAALKKSHGSMALGGKQATQATRDARDAFDQAAQQALNLAEAEAKLPGGVSKARASLQASITALKQHAGNSAYAKTAINELQTALDQLPGAATKAANGLKSAGPSFKTAGEDAAQGYADGISKGEINAIKAAVHMGKISAQAAAKAIGSASPSKVFKAIGSTAPEGYVLGIKAGMPAVEAVGRAMSSRVVTGFLAGQPQVIEALKQSISQGISAVNSVVSSEQSKLSSDISSRASAASSISSGLAGNFALTNAFGPYGNVLNLSSFFGAGANQLHLLKTDLGKLRAKHLAPGLIAALAQGSPQQDIALATSILSGASGPIGTINREFAALNGYAGLIGGSIAGTQFDQMIAHDRAQLAISKQVLAVLQEIRDDNKKNPKALASALDAAIKGIEVHRR